MVGESTTKAWCRVRPTKLIAKTGGKENAAVVVPSGPSNERELISGGWLGDKNDCIKYASIFRGTVTPWTLNPGAVPEAVPSRKYVFDPLAGVASSVKFWMPPAELESS